MPHLILKAPSGRSKCRACKAVIEKASLRLGEEVENAFGEGTATHWYHLSCGALRRPDAFLDAWQAFSQEDGGADTGLSQDAVSAWERAAELGRQFPRLSRFVRVEEAPSGRARCQGCRELIEKGELRFVLERIEDGMASGAGFVHLGCAHAYAGAVDGVLERVRPGSELTNERWCRVEESLAEQAQLPRAAVES